MVNLNVFFKCHIVTNFQDICIVLETNCLLLLYQLCYFFCRFRKKPALYSLTTFAVFFVGLEKNGPLLRRAFITYIEVYILVISPDHERSGEFIEIKFLILRSISTDTF